MTLQYINTGSGANAGNGDSIRAAFTKVNNNFAQIEAGNYVGSSAGGAGYTGSRGYIGYTGSSGAYAAVGYTGSFGYTGSIGVGYTGSIGAGYTGSIGMQGDQGPIGNTGTQGIQGSTGTQGPIGLTGDQGPIGNTGTQGIQGSTGTQGVQGPIGLTGDQGIQGSTGTQGPRGFTGEQGVSVTLVGSTGTVGGLPLTGNAGDGWIVTDNGDLWFWSTINAQWEDIGQIVGPQGDPGAEGPQGPQGLIGNTGTQGPQGSIGPEGPQGPIGSEGPQGLIGNTGTQGSIGPEGPQGPIGPQGEQGLIGNTGTQGIQGLEGPQGPTGPKGDQGLIGNTGTQGVSGYTGSIGNTGTVGYTGSMGTLGYTGSMGTLGYTGSKGADGGNANTANFIFTASQVSVSDDNDITLVTNANTWTFGADGSLTLPNSNTQISSYGMINTASTVALISSGFAGGAAIEWIDDITTATSAAAVIVNSLFSSSTGSVQILTGAVSGPVTENIWEFSADGTLTAPGHLLPNADLAYDLGSTTTQWRSIYVGTGTIFIGGVALGVNQDNFVTVDGNPIITVNTAGNLTVQGDVVIGTVTVSETAPTASTGTQWFNTVDGRTYIAYNGQWLDASPVVVPSPGTYLGNIDIDGDTLNINGNTLTISNTGTLLVNGSEVTGSGTGSSTHIEYTDGQSGYTSTVDLGYNFEVDVDDAHLNINGDGTWSIGSNNFDTKIFSTIDPGNDPTVIVVRAGDDDWTFGPLGWFTLPGGSVIKDGMGAIRLEPWGASSATQALLIYPTVQDGNHIHLTAGGGETDLYLGNDIQYVKVDHSGDVVIGTLGINTSTWTFGTDGVLTLPADTPVIKGGGTGTDVTIIASTGSNTSTWVFAADGVLTLPVGGDIFDSNGSSVLGGSGDATGVSRSDDNLIIRLTDPNNDGLELRSILVNGSDQNVSSTVLGANGFVISTNSNVDQKQWQFGNDGGLTFPDSTVQDTAFTGTVSWSNITNQPTLGITEVVQDTSPALGGNLETNGHLIVGGPYGSAQLDVNLGASLTALRQLAGPTGGVFINTSPTDTVAHTWTFGYDGSLKFPGGGTLRMSTAPTSSTGAAGDKAGTIAVNSASIFYCIADYFLDTGTYSAPTTNSNDGSVFFIEIAKGSYPQPQIGWGVSISGNITQIDGATTDLGSSWKISVGAVTAYSTGTSVTLTNPSPSQSNIWVKQAWGTTGSW